MLRDTFFPPNVQVFDANGTWYKPGFPYTRAFVWVCSAGGGASGCQNGLPSSGGGGGAVWYGWFDLSQLSATESVTVGAAGTGGAANGGDGTDGGTSRFGTRHVAPGAGTREIFGVSAGQGGVGVLGLDGGAGAGTDSTGGGGGGASGGGVAGHQPLRSTTAVLAGLPGSCVAGCGGDSGITNGPGGAGRAPGGGGGGTLSNVTPGAGGAGANGRVVVICI